MLQSGDPAAAMVLYGRAAGHPQADSSDRVVGARGLIDCGLAFEQLGSAAGAESAYDEVVSRFGDLDDPGLRASVGWAMYDKAKLCERLGRVDEALAIYDEIVSRFPASGGEIASAHSPRARVSKAALLNTTNRFALAIIEADKAISESLGRQGEFEEQLARASLVKSYSLAELGQYSAILEVADLAFDALKDARDRGTRQQLALLVYNRAHALDKLGRKAEAAVVYRSAAALMAQDGDEWLQTTHASATLNEGMTLIELGRVGDGIEALDRLWPLLGESADTAVRAAVAKGAWAKARALSESGDPNGAVECYLAILGQFDDDSPPTIQTVVAHAAYECGVLYERHGLHDEALTMLTGFIDRFRDVDGLDVFDLLEDAKRRVDVLEANHP